jgi:hypothetical protein
MLILFRTFDELSQVLFLCKNLSMKSIYDLYLSNDDKDILFEIERLELEDATISNNSELRLHIPTAISRQIGTVADTISANNTTTANQSRVVVGIG